MPIRNFLTVKQKKKLQKALKESDCPLLRERILILLLRNEGRIYQEISDFLGCSYRTVAYWCVHGDPDNLEGMKDKRREGKPRKATEDYIRLLMELIEQDPRELGYEFDRWSGERLASHLKKLTDIELSGSQVRHILRKNNVRLPLRKKYRSKAKRKGNKSP